MKQLATTKRRACPKGEGVDKVSKLYSFKALLTCFYHSSSATSGCTTAEKSKIEWLQITFCDQSKKFLWYHLSKCFVLFIMCVVTYGFQMESTFELAAVKSNHEARQYLWTEPDIIFPPPDLTLLSGSAFVGIRHQNCAWLHVSRLSPRSLAHTSTLTRAPFQLSVTFSFHYFKPLPLFCL